MTKKFGLPRSLRSLAMTKWGQIMLTQNLAMTKNTLDSAFFLI
ncbi:hypothetical protein [Helicobacter sp. 23-1045]